MCDCLIIGAGVIGLSLAYDLAKNGLRVRVIDQGEPGREASWAGAGILPPAGRRLARHPYDQLRALSHELHPQWAAALCAETGLDNGYQRCGAVHLARGAGDAASLRGAIGMMQEEQIETRALSPQELGRLEPLLGDLAGLRAAFLVPDEAQVRNPRHLQALLAACRVRQVEILPRVAAMEFIVKQRRMQAVVTKGGRLYADRFCVTAGAWTKQLASPLSAGQGVVPIRGQMLLFRCPSAPFSHIINEGTRYLVPRDDGRVLAGSTEEEAGFDKRTTKEGLAELQAFALSLAPSLAEAEVEQEWAGLRPATLDRFPYMGRLPEIDNAYLSAGHYRSGLHLAPAAAEEMSRLIRGQPTRTDLTPFRPGRG